jgi:hypothetical protein
MVATATDSRPVNSVHRLVANIMFGGGAVRVPNELVV